MYIQVCRERRDSAIIFVFIVCILQLLNKFSSAFSYQHFSCFVYPLTTGLIFAVRRTTPRATYSASSTRENGTVQNDGEIENAVEGDVEK